MHGSQDTAEHCNAAGNDFYAAGQFEDALSCYRRALEINPGFSVAHNNLGEALYDLGQYDAAIESFRHALAINPDLAEAHNNLGDVLFDCGQLEEAVASYRRALELAPGLVPAYCNMGMLLRHLGRHDEALASVRRALEIDPQSSNAHSILLFILNSIASHPEHELLQEARRFGELAARNAAPFEHSRYDSDPEKCLRVGFVSGDLHRHPVGYFFESVLTALSSQAAGCLQLVVYQTHFLSDGLTERIKAVCHTWHNALGMSDEALASWIHDDGIDILIDLAGHTAHQRLTVFAWKPAPVQVSWLGYFATTGVAAIDYLIADPWTLPEAEQNNFTEQIWRLPETRLCFSPPDMAVDVSPLPALTNGYVTFGCFNNLAKMSDAVVALWSRVLQATPDSRLLLKAIQLGEASVVADTLRRFAAHGIAADRIILHGPESREAYLRAYHAVDIALDPFPFPGGTTTVEGLWMGVPVLTLAGERFLSRQGVGILMNAGLPQWVAVDEDDYLAKAVAHAADLNALSHLRARLRQQLLSSPICDAPRFARHFEDALRGMWRRWCAQR